MAETPKQSNTQELQGIGSVKPREISQEMRESYIDYAMSVIVARALPDVRDGLKPVHRRILYAMHEDGLTHGAKSRKSATVVGSTLGRYHPHGDISVYDAMARMAQDFSMRYPLIEGQGNFGCFTKDTKVKLTDGRNVSFEDLVKEHYEGRRNYTYTVNSLGLISIAEIRHPRLTRKNAELVSVVLDNGEKIRCTPNHKFMLKDRTYREAMDLKEGDSLMPVYERLSEKTDRIDRQGYLLIYQPTTDAWVPVHHLADNYNLTNQRYLKNAGRVRHHIDFNKLNNNPENIVRISWAEHWQVHYEHAKEQHQNPEYRAKIAAGRKVFWANAENRERYSRRLSQRNIKNWKDPAYREKMRVFLSEVNKKYIEEHPEQRKEFSARATRTLKRLWQTPEYRALFHEKIIKGNKNHTTNRTGRMKFIAICREIIREHSVVDSVSYEQMRNKVYPYGRAPLWENGLQKYYQNSPELVLRELHQNHKVVRVERILEREDVYDLTIDGTHNFALAAGIFVHNSIDGDSPAAMRYTEARMSRIGEYMLSDINKNTVDFTNNYDGTRTEPTVLPSPMPQLLLNGTLGIAVGMATSIPSHNLTELVDALLYLIENEKATTEDLFQFVKGPDFPGGGIIYDKKAIIAAYSQGKGPIVVRGKAEVVEEGKGSRSQIIITEIPYQVNKSSLVEQFANLVQEKKVDGIKDIRDESDKDGLRIVFDLQRDAYPQKVLNVLYKFSDLQKTFHLNMLALVDGIQPRTLSLEETLWNFFEHKKKVVERRTRFELARAKDRSHILEGLLKCLAKIDEVIRLIRASANREEALLNLMKRFQLSEVQAHAILETKLAALAKLERKKIEDEMKELEVKIKELESILASPKKLTEVVKKELVFVRDTFGDERRTKVQVAPLGEIAQEDLIPQEETIITLTQGGYIKRINPATYKIQKRGGKGIVGMKTMGEDIIEHFLYTNTHDQLMVFTDSGKVFQVPAYEIPEGTRVAKGRGLLNFVEISSADKVLSLFAIGKQDKEQGVKHLVMITKNGIMKKTSLEEFKNVRKSGLIAISLKKGDELRSVRKTTGEDELIITTKKGQSVRFSEKAVRPMGRSAAGLRGIRLKVNDAVVGADVIPSEKFKVKSEKLDSNYLFALTENGYGKRTDVKEYRSQSRGGSGVKTVNVTPKTGTLVYAKVLNGQEEDLIVISMKGQVIRTQISAIPKLSRATQGVRIMRLDAGDKVISAACI